MERARNELEVWWDVVWPLLLAGDCDDALASADLRPTIAVLMLGLICWC